MAASQTTVERNWPASIRADYGILWVGLALLGMIAFYWSGLVSLPESLVTPRI